MKCAATTWVYVQVYFPAYVCLHACMLTHTYVNVWWGSDRPKPHVGGGHNMAVLFHDLLYFLVEWPDAISSTWTMRWQPKRDARCRRIAPQNEMRNQRGAEKMKTEDRREERTVQECSIINANPPVNDSQKKTVLVLHLSLFFSLERHGHTFKAGWTLHLIHNKPDI